MIELKAIQYVSVLLLILGGAFGINILFNLGVRKICLSSGCKTPDTFIEVTKGFLGMFFIWIIYLRGGLV